MRTIGVLTPLNQRIMRAERRPPRGAVVKRSESHPEMEAFADRLGFRFVAQERGDANRSARVERPKLMKTIWFRKDGAANYQVH